MSRSRIQERLRKCSRLRETKEIVLPNAIHDPGLRGRGELIDKKDKN